MHTFSIIIHTVILNLNNLCSWDYALKRFPTLPSACSHLICSDILVCSRVCTWLTPWDASPTPPVIPLTASSASSLANQRDILVFSTATPSLPKLLNRYCNFIHSNSFYKPLPAFKTFLRVCVFYQCFVYIRVITVTYQASNFCKPFKLWRTISQVF